MEITRREVLGVVAAGTSAAALSKGVVAMAGKYIDAFFSNINWQEVNRRFERAAKLGAIF
jgi:hypothetical protein